MTFSVLIYAEHEPESLADTLKAIAGQHGLTGRAEVIVLDQLASPERQKVAAAFGARQIVPRSSERAAAWNEGVAATNGDFVAFTDDDCLPTPDWLAQYETSLSAGTAMLGGPDKVPRNAPRFLRYLDYVLTSFSGSAGLRTTGNRGDAYYPRHWNMVVARKIIADLGQFDEGLPDAVELDMANRIRAAGHTVGFVPGAKVLHQRETNLSGFLRRNVVLSWARAGLPRKRFVYAAPALAAGAAVFLLVAARSLPVAGVILAAATGAYVTAAIGCGLHASVQMRDPLAMPAIPSLLFLQHLTHAIGYGVGILVKGFTWIGRSLRDFSRSSGVQPGT
jgi:GT2 family glycosyltransferase